LGKCPAVGEEHYEFDHCRLPTIPDTCHSYTEQDLPRQKNGKAQNPREAAPQKMRYQLLKRLGINLGQGGR